MKSILNKVKTICLLVLITVLSIKSYGQANNDKILGTYLTQDGTAKLEFYKTGSKYSAKIVWLKDPLDPKTHQANTDTENPDKSLKSRPIMGLVMVQNVKYNGKDSWENGSIYDPNTGKTWDCDCTLTGNKLKVKGYWNFSLFGKAETWTKTN